MLFHILRVEGVGIAHTLPAGEAVDGSRSSRIAIKGDVEEFAFSHLVRHEIVNFVNRQSAIQSLYKLVVAHHPYVGVFLFFLNRQEQEFFLLVES